MKKLLAFLLLVVFLSAGCASQNTENKKSTEQDIDTVENVTTDSEVGENEIDNVANSEENVENNSVDIDSKVDFFTYENKAIGYTISIPDKWYWQHFMKNEIAKAGGNDLINDYLIVDKDPLLGLGSEYLGQIIVEVSNFNLDDLAKDKIDYDSKKVTVSGIQATKFENINNGKKMIEYHFEKSGSTFRLIFISNDNNENQAIFEKMVSSFSFNN